MLRLLTNGMANTFLLLLFYGMSSCSGDQQQSDPFEVQSDEQQEDEDESSEEQQGEDNVEEVSQEQEENFNEEQEFSNDVGENTDQMVEDIGGDNAIDNAIGSEFQQEAGIEAGDGMNNATENEFASEAATEAPAIDTGVEEVVDQAAASEDGANENLQQDDTEPAKPTSGGRVKYILSSSPIFSGPDQQEVVGTLEQGDHPLVFEEGEWARTPDGHYIPASSLSEAPIGRFEPDAVWQ